MRYGKISEINVGRRKGILRNTAISATHMEGSRLRFGGGDMVKVRLQGTKEDAVMYIPCGMFLENMRNHNSKETMTMIQIQRISIRFRGFYQIRICL